MVDDLDARLADIGVAAPITLGPLDFSAFVPGWKSVWLADPEGNMFQLTQGFTDQEIPRRSPDGISRSTMSLLPVISSMSSVSIFRISPAPG